MLAWRFVTVIALAIILGFSGQSLAPHGTLQGHVSQCAVNSTADIVDVWQSTGDGEQNAIAWQRVSDFGTYQFNLSPGNYIVGTDPDHVARVRVQINSLTTQDLGC